MAFLTVVRPALEEGSASRLADAVKLRWTQRDLAGLLGSDNVDVRRSATLVLGLIGNRQIVGRLARCLHDDDEQVRQMAEHALWSIWFRVCECDAAEPFQHGVDLLAEEDYIGAIAAFDETIERCPKFAEAYNQRAIAHFFAGDYQQSADDCRQALQLMPSHFGAAAGLGHSLCHLGDLPKAVESYQQALAINPHMPGIRSAMQRIQAKLANPAPKPPASKARYWSN